MENMNKRFDIEVCVSSLEMAMEAEKGGADRIELCANLLEGGTTPSPALIKMAKDSLKISTMVMIRPRGGDFCYSDIEFETMKNDILYCKGLNIDGVVLGILNPDGTIDKQRTKQLVEQARPMKVCFHRAIDMTKDYMQAFKDILECGCDRILTSGGENKAIDGVKNIAEIMEKSQDRIEIMVGSGVSSENAKEIYNKTVVNHFHLSAKTFKPSKMEYHNPRISMGGISEVPEYNIVYTDPNKIKAIREVLDSL